MSLSKTNSGLTLLERLGTLCSLNFGGTIRASSMISRSSECSVNLRREMKSINRESSSTDRVAGVR